jgi:lysozyme
MTEITSLETQLLRDEGEILHAYQDSRGYWTIGVGRLIDERKGGGISKDESRLLLGNDITKVMNRLAVSVPWILQLDSVRAGVLQNMDFNIGIDGLLEFKNTLALIKAGDYEAASDALLESAWATQVGPRAQRLALQMRTGEWV